MNEYNDCEGYDAASKVSVLVHHAWHDVLHGGRCRRRLHAGYDIVAWLANRICRHVSVCSRKSNRRVAKRLAISLRHFPLIDAAEKRVKGGGGDTRNG